MRAKVIVAAIAVALVIVISAFYCRFGLVSAPPAPSPPATDEAASDSSSSAFPTISPTAPHRNVGATRSLGPLPAQEDAGADLNSPNHSDYVEKRKGELMDLAASDDPAALRTILGELNNKDADIRKTALAAAVEVGSPDAIPTLRNQMAWAEDPQEKVDIQSAIEFLQLPPGDQVKEEAMGDPGGMGGSSRQRD
jgi:HEAT repeat protein